MCLVLSDCLFVKLPVIIDPRFTERTINTYPCAVWHKGAQAFAAQVSHQATSPFDFCGIGIDSICSFFFSVFAGPIARVSMQTHLIIVELNHSGDVFKKRDA